MILQRVIVIVPFLLTTPPRCTIIPIRKIVTDGTTRDGHGAAVVEHASSDATVLQAESLSEMMQSVSLNMPALSIPPPNAPSMPFHHCHLKS